MPDYLNILVLFGHDLSLEDEASNVGSNMLSKENELGLAQAYCQSRGEWPANGTWLLMELMRFSIK